MAIRQREAPTTINAGDHIYEATADTAVTSIHMCNITSSNATINIYLLPEDGSTTAPTEENKIYTSGGRVLSVVAQGANFDEAFNRAYEGMDQIHFNGINYRKDIGNQVRKS